MDSNHLRPQTDEFVRQHREPLRASDRMADVLNNQQAQLKVRGFRLAQRRTSVSLENAFWEATRAIAQARRMSIQDLITEIHTARGGNNLSSAIRTFVLEYYRAEAGGEQHV